MRSRGVAGLLGVLVVLLGFVAVMLWSDARNARDEAKQASASVATSGMAGMDMSASATTGSLTSYAGAAPANADELAAAHTPYSAALPPAQTGSVASVDLALTDINIQIGPGIHYSACAWAGGAPRP